MRTVVVKGVLRFLCLLLVSSQAHAVTFTLTGQLDSIYDEDGVFPFDGVVGQDIVLTSTYEGTLTGVGRETLDIGTELRDWGISVADNDPGYIERPEVSDASGCDSVGDAFDCPISAVQQPGQLIFQDGELVGVTIATDTEGSSDDSLNIVYPDFGGIPTGTWTPASLSPFPEIESNSNASPLAEDDDFVVGQPGQNVLDNDSDADGDELIALLVDGPDKGELTLNQDGTFIYTPNTEAIGDDFFTYQARDRAEEDPEGENSNVARVTLTPAANTAPVAVDDDFGSNFSGGNVLANDSDADEDDLIAILDSGPGKGTLTLSPDGSYEYQPSEGATGEDTFTYRARDRALEDPAGLESEVATVTFDLDVVQANDPPVARDDLFGPDFSGANLLENDTDPNGDSLVVVLETGPAQGELNLNPDGSFDYTPQAGASGEVSFTYRARDRAVEDPTGLESNLATVTLVLDEEDLGEGSLTDKVDDDGYSVLDNATTAQLDMALNLELSCPELKKLEARGVLTADQEDLLAVCRGLADDNTNARQTVAALEAITPEEILALTTAIRLSASVQAKNIRGRIAGVRSGTKGLSVSGLNIDYEGTEVSGMALQAMLDESMNMLGGGASADETQEISQVNDFGNLGVFVKGEISFGDHDETEKEAGYDLDNQTLIFGVDYRFTDQLFLGVTGSVGVSELDFARNRGDADMDEYGLAIFGSYYTEQGAYIDGIAGYLWADIDTQRNINYEDVTGLTDRAAKGETDGELYYFSVSGGHSFNFGAWNLTPSLQFFYMDGQADDYQEKGAGGLNLAYQEQDFQSTRFAVSGQASYVFTTGWGVLVPFARVEYTTEFEDSAKGLLYNLASAPVEETGERFLQIKGEDPDSSYLIYTAGTSAQFKYGFSAYATYSILGSYDYLDNENLSFGLRWETTF